MAVQNATGRELRATRVAYGVRAADVAAELGVSSEWVRRAERSVMPKASAVARYRRGLERVVATNR